MQLHYKIQWNLLRPLARSYFHLQIRGSEHIPQSGPLLIAANHCSYLDPPLIALALPRQITFLAKEELFKIPFFGRYLRWVGSYPVSRKEGDVKAIRSALKILGEEKALLVFPEGTRSFDGELQALESGISWLAFKSGAKVIPVYLEGSHRAMPRKAFFPRPKPVTIEIGRVLDPLDYLNKGTGKESIQQFTQTISRDLRHLQFQARGRDRKVKKTEAKP